MSALNEKIKQIRNNHSHGSSVILQEIIEVFKAVAYNDNEILKSFSELKKIDSSMVIIHHFLRELKPKIGHQFRKHVQQYQNKWQNVNIEITDNLKGYLPDKPLTILTHSHSGVIIAVLMNLLNEGIRFEIIQTESLPGDEGRIQAKALRQIGLNISIIKDEDVINSMDNINCCFIGVDNMII